MSDRSILACVAAVVVLCSAGTFWGGGVGVAVATAFALPLTFVLPGYALLTMIGRDATTSGVGRLVVVLSTSIGVMILLTLLLNFLPGGMTKLTWIMGLALVTCTFFGIAALRDATPRFGRLRPPRVDLRSAEVLLLVTAASLIGAAIWSARTPRPAQGAQGYTMLWLSRASAPGSFEVGIQSGELNDRRYRLVVRSRSVRRVFENVHLTPGERFEKVLRVHPSGGRAELVRASLFVDGDRAIYRRTSIHVRPNR